MRIQESVVGLGGLATSVCQNQDWLGPECPSPEPKASPGAELLLLPTVQLSCISARHSVRPRKDPGSWGCLSFPVPATPLECLLRLPPLS